MKERSKTMYKYDLDFQKWKVCQSMHYGRADFTCLTLGTSNTLYVFGGTDSETHDKYIEKYESIIDVWTTMKYKIPLNLLSRGN